LASRIETNVLKAWKVVTMSEFSLDICIYELLSFDHQDESLLLKRFF
jgi:hypothetical protein